MTAGDGREPSRRFGRGPGSLYRRAQSLRFALTRDRAAIAQFMIGARGPGALRTRARLLWQFERITNAVRGYHTLAEMLTIAGHILERPGAIVVEAGAAKGSSTAKLSLAVRAVGGRLHVFDSFRGLPPNDERHTHLDGRPIRFRAGAFTGRLRSVQRTVARFGAIDVCEFHKGWFADTLPAFAAATPRPMVDVAVFDVDLLASTRACCVHVVPLLAAGGVAFTQDGHLRATVDLITDRSFWIDVVGVAPPRIVGAHDQKLLAIRPVAPNGRSQWLQSPAPTSPAM